MQRRWATLLLHKIEGNLPMARSDWNFSGSAISSTRLMPRLRGPAIIAEAARLLSEASRVLRLDRVAVNDRDGTMTGETVVRLRRRGIVESGCAMTPRRIRLGLAVFAAITGSLALNLLVLQPAGGRKGQPHVAYRGLGDLPGQPPKGTNAGEAERARLTASVAAVASGLPPQVESTYPGDAISETSSIAEFSESTLVRDIQSALVARGYSPGDPSGRLGLVTRAAIMAFEHDQGLTLTGEPTSALLQRLTSGELALVPTQASGPPGPEAESLIRTVQQSLERLGYRPGPADGVVGAGTMAALRAFERDQGLPETGRISGLMLVRLAGLAGRGRIAAR